MPQDQGQPVQPEELAQQVRLELRERPEMRGHLAETGIRGRPVLPVLRVPQERQGVPELPAPQVRLVVELQARQGAQALPERPVLRVPQVRRDLVPRERPGLQVWRETSGHLASTGWMVEQGRPVLPAQARLVPREQPALRVLLDRLALLGLLVQELRERPERPAQRARRWPGRSSSRLPVCGPPRPTARQRTRRSSSWSTT